MIGTTHGDMDEALLVRRDGEVDNENERTVWVEYWMQRDEPCPDPGHDMTIAGPDGDHWERVHRSAHVTLKQAPPLGAEQGGF